MWEEQAWLRSGAGGGIESAVGTVSSCWQQKRPPSVTACRKTETEMLTGPGPGVEIDIAGPKKHLLE